VTKLSTELLVPLAITRAQAREVARKATGSAPPEGMGVSSPKPIADVDRHLIKLFRAPPPFLQKFRIERQ
jgi:hypothetical protein